MPIRSRRIFSLLLVACGLALMLRPAAALSSSSPVVLINEFMPRPSSGVEWVELFNPNPYDLDIGNWKIDDDTIGGSQTTIAAGTLIPANGLLVISLSTNILNDSGTDVAQLLDAGGASVDSHSYSSATAGQSYARTPDGSATWMKGTPSQGTWNVLPGPSPVPTSTPTITPTSTSTPTNTAMPTDTSTPTDTATPTNTPTNTPTPTPSPTLTPYPTDMLINEFLAHPPTGGAEWIELYNAGSSAADLSGWQLDDIDGGSAPDPLPAGTTIAPGQFLVIELPSAIF